MNGRRFFQILLLAFTLFLLSACGIHTETTIEADARFNGQRVMVLTFDKNALSKIAGGADSVEILLTEYAPDSLKIETKELENGTLEVTAVLPFSGIEDYREKVNALLKRSESSLTPDIYFENNTEAVFRRGIAFRDNVETKELLGFFVKAAVRDGIIKENDDKIWDKEKASLSIDGEVLVNGSAFPIRYDTSEGYEPRLIKLFTERNEDGTWNRTIAMLFRSDEAKSLPADIAKTIIDSPEVKVNPLHPLPGDSGYSAIEFTLLKASEAEIADMTGKIFRDDAASFSYEIRVNDEARVIKELKEHVYDGLIRDPKNIRSYYYLTPAESPLRERIAGILPENADLACDGKQLQETYEYRDEILPVYESAEIEITLSPEKGITKRKIILTFPAEAKDRDAAVEAMRTLLGEGLVRTAGNALEIEYSGEDIPGADRKLFGSESWFEVDGSLFGYTMTYTDTLTPRRFQAKKLSVKINPPAFASAVSEDIREGKSADGAESVFVRNVYGGAYPVMIAIFATAAAILIFGGFFGYRRLKRRGRPALKKPTPSPEETRDTDRFYFPREDFAEEKTDEFSDNGNGESR